MNSAEYWKALPSAEYDVMFDGKYPVEFRAQEEWLRKAVAELPYYLPKVLEVGCGTGRLARHLSSVCRYHGMDQSNTMTERLRYEIDFEGLKAEVVPWISLAKHYAAIFTCSVLIHNTPEDAKGLIAEMCAAAPVVWLIENKPSEAYGLLSDEHGGCWVHDYRSMVPPGWTVDVVDLCKTHSVYVLGR